MEEISRSKLKLFARKIQVRTKKLHKFYKSFVPTHWRAKTRWVWGIALVSAILLVQFVWKSNAPLRVYFFDVGQGDGYLIRTADGFDVLVDGGPTGRIAEKLGRILPFWDKTIELMILTHPHADHVTGQIEVLRRFKVNKVLATGVLHTTDEYLTWLKEIKKRGVPLEIAKAGQEFPLRSTGSPSASQWVALKILWPEEDFSGQRAVEGKIGEGGGLNDTSVVAKLTYGDTSFLFMGDATSAVEEQLIANNVRIKSELVRIRTSLGQDSDNIRENRLKADVLKVGHHGSKYSTTTEFLKAVQPRYAVIQVGQNRYGHPAFATLWRLNKAGAKVLRNDKDGDVVFESDGQRLDLVRRK